MGRYNKLYVALSGFLAAGALALQDGVVSGNDLMALGIAAVTAVGVFLAPNKPVA